MMDADKLTRGTLDGQGRDPGSGQSDFVWLNGHVLEVADAVSGIGRAVRYGDGLFATLRLDAGRLLDAELHADRLLSGAAGIGLDPPPGWLDVRQIVEGLLAAAGDLGARPESDGVLRCQWSATGTGRGFGRSGHSVALVELSGVPASRNLSVRVLDSDFVPRPSIPHIKTCSALPHVIAAGHAARLDVEEVIRVYDGWLAEGISANLFFERNGRLFTPDTQLPLYPGVVRQRVIEQASALGIEIVEGRWEAAELRQSDGAFLTGSVRGVEPVSVLDGRSLQLTPLIDTLARTTAEVRQAEATPLPGVAQ
jgi:branched-subunit amino acid aminotransferase/4-amino-4-deoxychorismate lyase